MQGMAMKAATMRMRRPLERPWLLLELPSSMRPVIGRRRVAWPCSASDIALGHVQLSVLKGGRTAVGQLGAQVWVNIGPLQGACMLHAADAEHKARPCIVTVDDHGLNGGRVCVVTTQACASHLV
jgi:hypothetical protein